MLVLILLIVAATLFGLIGIYRALPPRETWVEGMVAIGLCLVSIALAFWHGGR